MSKLHIFIAGIIIFCLSLILKVFQDLESKIVIFFNQFLFDLNFFSFLTEIGNGFFATALLVPFLSLLSSKLKTNYVPVQLMIVPALCIGLDVQFLKYILSFERPASIFTDEIIFLEPIFIAGRFPSGHAATVLSVILIWLSFALNDLKSKIFCTSNSYTSLKKNENNIIDFKFYQKLFIVLISLSTILIFPESPKELENICSHYNSRNLCNVW